MPEEVRPGTPVPDDDVGVINIPKDSVHPAMLAAPNAMHTLKRGEENVQVTTDQLIQMAQKGWNADALTQQAVEDSKGAARAIALQEDLAAAFDDDDVDAFRRVGASFGVDGAEVESIIQTAFSDDDDDEGAEDEDVLDSYNREATVTRSRQEQSGPINYAQLAPDLRRALKGVEQQRIGEIVEKALDSDESLSYNMSKHTTEGQAAIRSFVDEKIRGRLDSYGGDFGDGARILAEIIPEVRDHLQALGTPNTTGPMGLGHAPGGGDMEVYPKTQPDHVSSNEGDAYEQNILETIAWHQANAERGRS